MELGELREILRSSIVLAPMAGGTSTPELVTGATREGALGFVAAGYKSTAQMTREIDEVRSATTEAFGVNVFVPGRPSNERAAVESYLETLDHDTEAFGVALGEPVWDDDDWTSKIEVLVSSPVAIVSFTFGCPTPEVMSSLKGVGTIVGVTVTRPEEAHEAVQAGADCLFAQGLEAGAHRGSFTNDDRFGQDYGVVALVAEIVRETSVPVIAAGGIMTKETVAAIRATGAVAAQCGTAFLCCPESGATKVHKDALSDPRFTVTAVTRAFSGRRARSLVNSFLLSHQDAPAAYPEINNATRPLRAAAASANDADRVSLWAGQGYRAARALPVGEVVCELSG